MSLNNITIKILWLIVCSSLLLFAQCRLLEYDKEYKEVWDPNQKGADAPIITSVTPDSLVDGNREVTLIGQNFSPQIEENFVYFGDQSGKQMGLVTAASNSQLIILRPINVSGAMTIELAVRNAYQTASFSPCYLEVGIFQLPVDQIGMANSITMDRDENLYAQASRDKAIYKITPQGEQIQYGTTDFIATAMRMGQNGYLYLQRNNNRSFYRIPPGGGVAEKLPNIKDRVSYFDFDESYYIYSGGENGLCITNPDGSGSKVADTYEGWIIKAVRVFEGYVYVGVDTVINSISGQSIGKGIWKHEILGNGNIKEKELVFDWANSEAFVQSQINDITFSYEGDMYVATDNQNPILIIHRNGETAVLYEGLLASPATQICWGNGNYLYINRLGRTTDASGISRVIMGKKGAPYYGRL